MGDLNDEVQDLYSTLGVSKEMTTAEIKKHWREWARQNHPDVTGGDEEEFKRRSAAAEILTDQERRDRYDGTGRDRPEPDEIRASVLAICQQIVQSIINGGDMSDMDLVGQSVTVRVLELLEDKGRNFVHERGKIARRRRRIEKMMKRLKPKRKKAKDNDIVTAILKSELANVERDEHMLNKQEVIHFSVVEVWAGYGYRTGWGLDAEEAVEQLTRRLGPPKPPQLPDGDAT